MKQIPLTQNKFALVDDDTYLAVSHLKWHVLKIGKIWYAARNIKDENGKYHMMYLHHCIIGHPLNNLVANHIDGNGLNNQRYNLEIVTQRKNTQNKQIHRNGRLPGTCLATTKHEDKIYTYWMSYIRINGKREYLGTFNTEQEAYNVYLEALKKV